MTANADADEDVSPPCAARIPMRFVDVLLADLCGIPRGKRVTIDELRQVYAGGFVLPGSMFALDVLGGTIQETGLGFDEGDADRCCLPIAGTLAAGAVARRRRRRAGAGRRCAITTARRSSAIHAIVLAGVLERFPRAAPDAGRRDRARVLFARSASAPPAVACSRRVLPLSGRREHRTQINSMADLNEYSAMLAEIAAACAVQQIPSRHGARGIRTRTVRGQPASFARCPARLR